MLKVSDAQDFLSIIETFQAICADLDDVKFMLCLVGDAHCLNFIDAMLTFRAC